MPPVGVLLAVAVIAGGIWAGSKVVKAADRAAKKVGHAVVHTLRHNKPGAADPKKAS